MKEGWKIFRLLDTCDVYQPATISKKELVASGQYDVYGANGVIGKYDKFNHEESEVLLGCRGACGCINVSSPRSWINGNAMVVHPRTSELSKAYLVYLLRTLDYSKVITGTAQPQITRTSLSDVYIPVPPLSEQERIVSYLDAEFAKIDALKANIEQQLQASKDLFQSALKEYLEPKVGWADVCIKELGNCRIGPFGSLLHKSDYIEGGVPLINPMHIKGGKIEADIRYSVNKSKYQELKNYSLLKNDIILGRRGEMGRCAVVEDKEDGWLCGTGCMYLRPNIQKVNPHFLRYCLSSPVYVNKLTELAGGATMLNLSGSAFETLSIKIPNIDEQNAIISKLSLLADKVARLQANYDQTITLCNDLKQALLKSIFE